MCFDPVEPISQAGLFQTKKVSKYHIKICGKNNQEEWNSLNLTKRHSPRQTQIYEISACAKIETLNNSIREEVPLRIKGIQ